MDLRYRPEEIGPTEDAQRLRIRWGDGAVTEYTSRFLRLRCPCAACVDEVTGIRTLNPDRISPHVYPEAIHYVGRYALQFQWSDGHCTGIYPFDYLRRLSHEAEEDVSDV